MALYNMVTIYLKKKTIDVTPHDSYIFPSADWLAGYVAGI
jgi:hypothetical protein